MMRITTGLYTLTSYPSYSWCDQSRGLLYLVLGCQERTPISSYFSLRGIGLISSYFSLRKNSLKFAVNTKNFVKGLDCQLLIPNQVNINECYCYYY